MEVNRQGMDWQLDFLFTTCSLAPQSQWVMEKKNEFLALCLDSHPTTKVHGTTPLCHDDLNI
jgi:hypothetical protein